MAGRRSICRRTYRVVSIGYGCQDRDVWAALICCWQIYGYASSVCTKEKWLLSLPAWLIDFPQQQQQVPPHHPHLQGGPWGPRVSSRECQHCYFIRLTERDLLLSLHLGINKRSPAGSGSARLVCEGGIKPANELMRSRTRVSEQNLVRKQTLAQLSPKSTVVSF